MFEIIFAVSFQKKSHFADILCYDDGYIAQMGSVADLKLA